MSVTPPASIGPTAPHFTPRDLINVGVFSALYFVLLFALGMIGIVAPIMMLVGQALAVLANGVTIVLYLARLPKFGAMTLLGLINAVFMFTLGQVWYVAPVLVALGLLADLIIRVTPRRSLGVALGYAVFTAWYGTPMLPLFIDPEAYLVEIAQRFGQAYADGFIAIFSPTVILVWDLVTMAIAFAGARFGQSILRRHFARAGVAA